MIPILYEATERNFTTNGLGRLADAVECTVTEERNGGYELFMRYPTSGAHYKDISLERLIYAPHDDTKTEQPFRIYKISKPINGVVSVYAEHISYQLNKDIVEPFSASSCAQALTALEQKAIGGTEFTFWTDKAVVANFKVETPQSIRALLAGQSGSILDVYGTGEYEWDGFTVKFHLHRGNDSGVTLRYGKNITDIEASTDMENTYTAIVPFWKGHEDDQFVMLPEKILYAGTQYTNTLAKAVDFSSEWEEAPTVAQLRSRAQAYLTNNKGWEIKQNVKVDFVQLWQTEEYADYAPLQRVRLCDTVTVVYEPLDVETTAEIVKTVYNALLERYDEVEVGNASTTLSGAVADVVETTTADLPDKSMMDKAITHATDLIKGGLGGYVVLKTNANGQPEEILIMDSPDIASAVHVLRINKNGIGFSSNGYDGTYRSAWTLDGAFVADFITAGTMQANRVRAGLLTDEKGLNYWNLDSGEFKLSQAASQAIAKDGMTQENVFNALTNNGKAVGVFLKDGQLYMNASYINTGELSADLIKSGLLQSKNKTAIFDLNNNNLKFYDGNGNLVMELVNNGLKYYNAHDNTLVGTYAANSWTGRGQTRGLTVDMEYNAEYFAISAKDSANADTYTVKWTYIPKGADYVPSDMTRDALNAGCDIDMRGFSIKNANLDGTSGTFWVSNSNGQPASFTFTGGKLTGTTGF